MRDFNKIIQDANRIKQQNITPTAVKTRSVENDILQNSVYEEIPFTMNNNTSTTVNSVITGNVDGSRIGAVPYQIAFFEGTTVAGGTYIDQAATGDYVVLGPFCIPTGITIGDNTATENNLFFKTTIENHSGVTQNLVVAIRFRYIQGVGGGASA